MSYTCVVVWCHDYDVGPLSIWVDFLLLMIKIIASTSIFRIAATGIIDLIPYNNHTVFQNILSYFLASEKFKAA